MSTHGRVDLSDQRDHVRWEGQNRHGPDWLSFPSLTLRDILQRHAISVANEAQKLTDSCYCRTRRLRLEVAVPDGPGCPFTAVSHIELRPCSAGDERFNATLSPSKVAAR